MSHAWRAFRSANQDGPAIPISRGSRALSRTAIEPGSGPSWDLDRHVYASAAEQAVAQMQDRKLAELPHWPGRLRLRHGWMPEILDDGLRRAGLAS